MPPALRMPATPPSLALLRYLVRSLAPEREGHRGRRRFRYCPCGDHHRTYASTDATTAILGGVESKGRAYSALRPDNYHLQTKRNPEGIKPRSGFSTQEDVVKCLGERTTGRAVKSSSTVGDRPEFGLDFSSWDTFLKQDGEVGVLALWETVKTRGLNLPTQGPVADSLWDALLDVAVRDEELLSEICDYSNELFESSGKRWLPLYTHIMRKITSGLSYISTGVTSSAQRKAFHWHQRLVAGGHSPGPVAFGQFMRTTISKSSNIELLKTIYSVNEHRNAYSKIMKSLVQQDDLQMALKWHLFSISKGDIPHHGASHFVEPILDYLIRLTRDMEFEFQRSAARISVINARSTRINVEDVVEHSATLRITPLSPKPKTTIRELMNLAQGEVFHIAPKQYNDRLGARWLATTWVSLDFAINTLGSLGIPSVGPLSLQAICLREPDATSVRQRITQLKDLGVSIGKSVFSRAVLSFAWNGQQEYLTGILKSDQHPDALEDSVLQQRLLYHYASARDWTQYRLTVAIQLAIARDPQALSNDIALKRHATIGSWPELLNQLEKMHEEGIPVKQFTTDHIIRSLLGHRSRGKQLSKTRLNWQNLEMAIHILRLIIERHGQVSLYRWREIFRRLGSLGRLDDMERLSLWLVSWYGPSRLAVRSIQTRTSRLGHKTNAFGKSLLTLRLLFPSSLQKSIIEWSFIHAKPSRSRLQSIAHVGKVEQLEQYARGMRIIRALREKGVEIDLSAVRSALQNRFVVLFGPGTSLLPRNRILQAENLVTLEELRHKVIKELGEQIWPQDTDLKDLVAVRSARSMRHRKHSVKKSRDVTNLPRDGRQSTEEPALNMSYLGETG